MSEALLLLTAALAGIGTLTLAVVVTRLARQLAAVATLTQVTASLIEQQTGRALPRLEAELLDVAATTETPDTVSGMFDPAPWGLAPQVPPLVADRHRARFEEA